MNTQDVTLIGVLVNLIMTPIIQYILHSRCSRIECCCLKCDRVILEDGKENAQL